MEYTYKFATGEETIEVDEETHARLKDADRIDHNNARKYRRWNHSLDAYGWEPEFMGVEDDHAKAEIPNSPAYTYAMSHLTPRYQEILIRRLVYCEQFPKIAKEQNTSVTAVHHSYTKAKERFAKFYKDGLWLYSQENLSKPKAEIIHYIPFGLTITQVTQIRQYRSESKNYDEIAELVKVPRNRVVACLKHNPVLETKCLYCGAPIQQVGYGKLQMYCNRVCFFSKNPYKNPHKKPYTPKPKKILLDRYQEIAVGFYKQLFLPHAHIGSIIGKSNKQIERHFRDKKIILECKFCGKEFSCSVGNFREKYCSSKCGIDYWHYIRDKKHGVEHQITIPTFEQLQYAIELRDADFSYEKIKYLTGLTLKQIDTLFKHHNDIERICPICGVTFITQKASQIYCSQECKYKKKLSRARYKKIGEKKKGMKYAKKSR